MANRRWARALWTGTKRTFVVCVLAFLTAVVAGAFIFFNGVAKAEIPESPTSTPEQLPITIYHNDGKTQLAVIQPEGGVRYPVDFHSISDNMKNALVSAEDKTFWENEGFAPKRIVSAGLGYVTGNSSAGGASTITQQLIKNTVTGDEYSLDRKWKEILSAVKVTSSWTKEDIMNSYLNFVYFGRGSHGIEAAANSYFGKHASELNISESALLAGIIQSPSRWDPAVDEEGSKERFEYVIGEMLKNGYITDQEAKDAQMPKTLDYTPKESEGLTGPNGHIVTMVLQELENQSFDKKELHRIGANITTTIDPVVNATVQREAKAAADATKADNGVVATDPSTGGIRGLWGGENGLGFSFASNPQQTGSTFKIFALCAALEQGIGLDTMISSDPYNLNGTTIVNSDGMGGGMQTLAEATKQSLNTSFYRIQDMLANGPYDTRDMAHKLGVDAPLAEDDGSVNYSVTLGTYTTSMVDMSEAMAAISNNGIHNPSYTVERVSTSNGQLAYVHKAAPVRVLSEHTAQEVKKALAPIPAYSNGNQLAGGKFGGMKTGTTQFGAGSNTGQNRDALSVGFTDKLGIAIWFGNADGSPLTDVGGGSMWGAGAPSRLWKTILDQVG